MRKFEAGKTYSCNSVCDHNCVWTFKVIKRTANTITITGDEGQVRRKVYPDMNGNEMIWPMGQYSMAPILRAEGEVKNA